MSNYFWSIDEGHGGIDPNGNYTTPGSKGKQYSFDDGPTIYEGFINRQIGYLLKEKLAESEMDWQSVNNEIFDTPLRERVEIIDKIFHRERAKDKKAILISIHSNAMTKPDEIKGAGQNIASYNSVWTSIGQTLSDKIAEFFIRSYEKNMPDWRIAKEQSDGDGDFEADFYILRKSDGPAVLVENLFFDNRANAEFLLSNKGQQQIADTLFNAILDCEKLKPI